MNFLGHLYFSNNDPELQYANLLGDYIKGSNLEQFPDVLQIGIKLHREIDHYIDHHPVVLALLHELYLKLPKISGIAVDLYFDHLLAKNWSDYHSTPLERFIREFEEFDPEFRGFFPPDFAFVLAKMKEGQWLKNYQYFSGLEAACSGLSRRISFENNLFEAPRVLREIEKNVEDSFRKFMDDAIPHFTALTTDLFDN